MILDEFVQPVKLLLSLFELSCKYLISFLRQLNEAEKKIEELNNDQETLIDVFSEERDRRDLEEKNLRKKLQVLFLPNALLVPLPLFPEYI